MQKKQTLKVIGFIAENQYYVPVNMSGTEVVVFSYDNQLLLPLTERLLSELLDGHNSFFYQFGARIDTTFFIIEPKKYDEVVFQIESLLEETGLNEIYRPFKIRIEKELASNYKDQLAISIVVGCKLETSPIDFN